MSSSVFIESAVLGSEAPSDALDSTVAAVNAVSADSDLVVVYGKNNINYDSKGLEKLIEEKTLSSISVIRITSPTPSMQDEEEQSEQQANYYSDEDSLSSKDEGITTEDDTHNERDASDESDDENSGTENVMDSLESDEEEATDDRKATDKNKKNFKNKKTAKQLKLQKLKRTRKQRPEIVGLTIEEFFPTKDADAMVKDVLKKAGVPTIKQSEYEFQLYVIMNDHCYTPYTSQEQMKSKLAAEKIESEKQIIGNARKILPQVVASKQINKKTDSETNADLSLTRKEKFAGKTKKRNVQAKAADSSEEFIEDDDDIHDSGAEEEPEEDAEDDYTASSEESAETDNDRESDLDFDVNQRKGRKIKIKTLRKLKRTAIAATTQKQMQNKRPQHSQDDSHIDITTPPVQVQRANTTRTVSSDSARSTITVTTVANSKVALATSNKIAATAPSTSVYIATHPKPLSDAIAALPPIPKKQSFVSTTVSESKLTQNLSTQQTALTAGVRRGPIVQVSGTSVSTRNHQLQAPSQSVKEIVINKQVMASPKGGFTDINALLTQAEKTNKTTTAVVAQSTMPTLTRQNVSTSKGFMPLGVETAAKNQLPAQISIQTHQSSSELAAEHDKQLDLIDSIVQDEMQKSGMIEQQAASVNENIPELVKMLESTEKALESKNTTVKAATYNSNNVVDDIDIANAPLLETPEVDIPDDLLQHVVELMEDDKTLQAAVEKQVFGDDNLAGGANVPVMSTPPPLAPIFQQLQKSVQQAIPLETQPQAKSIIQMTISNVSPSPIVELPAAIANANTRVAGIHTPKTAPLVRKEPIQIVRGNGRVITLPPIEAPNTRAKRRAQTQPATQQDQNPNFTLNESSLDNSLQSNASFSNADATLNTTAAEKTINVTSGRRRVSKEGSTTSSSNASTSRVTKKTAATNKKGIKTGASAAAGNASKIEAADASESPDDDDDPNKLWCICRQPHNNRFMICCDVCGDWFHGTCVSITKAMGLEMEQKGIDWTCPKCVKKQEEKKQRKITDMLSAKKPPLQTPPVLSQQKALDTMITSTPTTSTIPMENNVTVVEANAIPDLLPNTSTPKATDVGVKKQIIEIKKIQSGQFIPLKQLEQTKKSPITIVTSGQRKLYPPTLGAKILTTPQSLATMPQASKRVVVLQNMPTVEQKSNTNRPPHQAQQLKIQKTSAEPPTACIVCKKLARPNSIYCSDDCIRKHVQNALHAFSAKSPELVASTSNIHAINTPDEKKKKSKGLFEDLLSMADRKPKAERVHVYERKSGRILTGNSAPTTLNLKKWLQDNPTFEVVQPGSVQAIEIEKKNKQRPAHPSSPTIISKNAAASPTFTLQAHHIKSGTTNITSSTKSHESPAIHIETTSTTPYTPLPKSVKQFVEHAKQSPNNSRPNTPKQLQKYPQQVSIKPDKTTKSDAKDDAKAKDKVVRRQNSESSSKRHNESAAPASSSTADTEPIIRLNVRRTLREQLLLRINEEGKNSAANVTGKDQSNITATSKPPQLIAEEVEEFVTEIEAEMYNYFHRDTGSKYKAKYRSLMFNIKDRKNHTLFTKICAKLIEPKQLVRMSPEELASQELAQWRENEAKHQLEMIKKSELDLLSCAKNYVLKTHKGEEVIEGKSTDCVNLDITIPVEDVVSVLNNSAVSSSSVGEESLSNMTTSPALRKDYYHSSHISVEADTQPSSTQLVETLHNPADEKSREAKSKSNEREKEKDDRDRDRERTHDREKDHEHERSHDHEKTREHDRRHKSKDRHRDKSRSRRRSHSRSRSRSRSREKRHKSSHKDERRDREEREHDRERERDRERDREKERSREKDRAKHKETDLEKKSTEKKPITKAAANSISSSKEKPRDQTSAAKKTTIPKPLEAFSLIDQILESTKTVEEAANLVTEKEKEPDKSVVGPTTPTQSNVTDVHSTTSVTPITIPTPNDDDEEPTSTVSISTPPQDPYIRFTGSNSPLSCNNLLWIGNINMIDVASFQIILQPVVGNSLNIGKLLPTELDVVGRIGPETVWDYISKIKRSPNKEIVIIRLVPSSETETIAYTHLYQYLDQRKRLGVIKTISAQIKDFYIFPLGAGKQMPEILQPIESVDFYDDVYRPDVLVGIVIRVIGKRMSTPATGHATAPTTTTAKQFARKVNEVDSFTPPGSPKRRKRSHSVSRKGDDFDIDAIIKAPIAAKIPKPNTAAATASTTDVAMDDADEPYSPGGSSDDDVPLLPLKLSNIVDTHKHVEDELKRKMDELNRQIAAQEMEIAGLLNVEPTRFANTADSSAAAASNVLANISIPSNLSQILASIKGKTESPPMPAQIPSTAPPPPPTISSIAKNVVANDDEEYNPELAMSSSYEAKVNITEKSTSSRLAQLSEAELLSMVPDDMIDQTSNSSQKSSYEEEPPPPGV